MKKISIEERTYATNCIRGNINTDLILEEAENGLVINQIIKHNGTSDSRYEIVIHEKDFKYLYEFLGELLKKREGK